MFELVVALAAVAQAPEYVAGYKPKVGDRVVLARDEAARRVPIVKNAGAAISYLQFVEGPSEDHYEMLVNGDELAEIDAGTPAQLVEEVKTRTPIFGVRILAGPSRGKTTYTYATFCRRPNPAAVKAVADARKKRAPLDKGTVAEDVKGALATAKPNESNEDLRAKKKLVREAVDPICKKYNADYTEVNGIATKAGVFVTLNGQKYDVAGNRVRN